MGGLLGKDTLQGSKIRDVLISRDIELEGSSPGCFGLRSRPPKRCAPRLGAAAGRAAARKRPAGPRAAPPCEVSEAAGGIATGALIRSGCNSGK